MSSILSFVVVAAILGVVAHAAIEAATQPATTDDDSGRADWSERGRALIRWLSGLAGSVTAWSAAVVASGRRRRTERRDRKAAAAPAPPTGRSEESGAAPAATDGTGAVMLTPRPGPRGMVIAPLSEPEGVVTTALRVQPDPSLHAPAGEELRQARPSGLARVRSALGLVGLIVLLGLGLATALGAIVTVLSATMDGIVN